jgi:hypothetical protein
MESFISYFDILGFKEFIENSEEEIKHRLMNFLMRDSQSAISGNKYIHKDEGTMVPDLSETNINCLHVSDSIIFWTNDLSEGSFIEMVKCCAFFLIRCLQITFPVRGCLVLGDIAFSPFNIKNKKGTTFYNSSLYGKGLVDAYLKAESQDWAGCFVDKGAINSVDEKVIDALIYDNTIAYYPVPLKDGIFSYEYAIRTIPKTINNVYFKNLSKGVEENFNRHMNGKPLTESVKRKLTNTIKFYDYFRNNSVREEQK